MAYYFLTFTEKLSYSLYFRSTVPQFLTDCLVKRRSVYLCVLIPGIKTVVPSSAKISGEKRPVLQPLPLPLAVSVSFSFVR